MVILGFEKGRELKMAKGKQKGFVSKIIFTVITALIFVFIITRSLMNGNESQAESQGFMEALNVFFSRIGMSLQAVDIGLLRKAAHFTEFFVLGLFLSITMCKFDISAKGIFFPAAFTTLATAVIDESVQYLSPGRSPQVSDVIIDFAGAITGILLVILILIIRKVVKHR